MKNGFFKCLLKNIFQKLLFLFFSLAAYIWSLGNDISLSLMFWFVFAVLFIDVYCLWLPEFLQKKFGK